MFNRSRLLTSFIAASLLASQAMAGPVQDFEAALRSAYSDYRAALFHSNSGDSEKTLASIDSFQQKWDALASANTTPPPHYADDSLYAAAMTKVSAIALQSENAVKSGHLEQAHDELEGIREEISGLHERNNIVSFSDRMNAYHSQMETVLKADYHGLDEEGLGALREDVAILAYLATELAENAGGLNDDPVFTPLLAALQSSVTNLQDAARKGDKGAVKAGRQGLKKPYSHLFLKFG